MGRRMVVWGLAGLGILVVLMLASGFDIWRYGFESDDKPADVALVLGAAVEGNKPSPVYEERLRHAVDLYKAGQVRKLIFTGGLAPGDSLAESAAGADWAMAQGVPASEILIEVQSRTTLENIDFSKPLIAPGARVLLVSDPLHMRRAMLIAQSRGLDAAPSPTPTTRYRSLGTQLPFLLREMVFTAKFLLTGTD